MALSVGFRITLSLLILLPKLRGSVSYPGGTDSHRTRQPSLDAQRRRPGSLIRSSASPPPRAVLGRGLGDRHRGDDSKGRSRAPMAGAKPVVNAPARWLSSLYTTTPFRIAGHTPSRQIRSVRSRKSTPGKPCAPAFSAARTAGFKDDAKSKSHDAAAYHECSTERARHVG